MILNNPLQAILLKTYQFFVKTPWKQKVEKEVNKVYQLVQDESNSADSPDTNSAAAQKIADIVSTRGYMIFPKIISEDILEKLRSEYHTILTTDVNTFRAVDRHDGAVCVRMMPFFNINNVIRYPAISAFFSASLFYEITKIFYANSKNGFNYISEIFVHETPETKDPLSEKLHWDRAQTLKFWIYLDDIPIEAGPMRVEPYSVERNRAIRIQAHSEKTVLIGGVDNVVESPAIDPIALTAVAGSILIHNTDASHGATEVMPGYARKIMRGHCRAKS